MDLDDAVAGAAAAHQRLLATIDDLTDDTARQPSLLPDWTVGHVLTHIARNADSLIRVFDAAGRGEVVDRYEGGKESRNREIETGAGRSAGELVDDVRSTIWRLEQAWAGASETAWQGRSRETGGYEIPVTDLPFARWREVEVHHADLGLGFGFDDWSEAYVAAELETELPKLADRLPSDVPDPAPEIRQRFGDPRLLAWLLGRWTSPELPQLPPWR
jgi:maleylpyruvate isomerase